MEHLNTNELLRVIDEVRQEVCDRDLTAFTYECYKGSRVSNNYEVNKNGSNIFKFEITIQNERFTIKINTGRR